MKRPQRKYRCARFLIRGDLRILPDLAPLKVSTMTGLPSNVPPSTPLVASYSSTCSRVWSFRLGGYSLSRSILKLSYRIRLSSLRPFEFHGHCSSSLLSCDEPMSPYAPGT